MELKPSAREQKLETALRELSGFAERNVERSKRAFEAEKAKPHDADSTDLDVAEARYHDAQRFYLVVNERVKEALAP